MPSDSNTWRPVGTGATDAAAGNHTHTLTIAADSGTNALTLAASTKYKITAGGSTFIFTTAPDTKYTAASSAPGDIATSGSAGSSTNYARQDHTHKIALATGDSNGQVKIAGSNVSVKGLQAAAYCQTEAKPTVGSAKLVTSNGINNRIAHKQVTLGTSGWSTTVTYEGKTCYKKSFSSNDFAADTHIIDVCLLGSDVGTDAKEQDFAKIVYAETSSNAISFVATSAPSNSITVVVSYVYETLDTLS